jgi:hypothetical protein
MKMPLFSQNSAEFVSSHSTGSANSLQAELPLFVKFLTDSGMGLAGQDFFQLI